ncbi:MAG: hypothetical protein IBX56_02710 [Methylomicrobium sp.]|nr:hypothetical protein [Methylomicrobium sp.]
MKSRTTSFVLTLLLGALGVMYTSVPISLLLLTATVISLPTGVGPLIVWIMAIFWGDALVKQHNAELHGSLYPPRPTNKHQPVNVAAGMSGKPAQELPKIVTEGVKLPKPAQYAVNVLLGVAAIFALGMVLLIGVAVVQTVSDRMDAVEAAEEDMNKSMAEAERAQSKLCKLLGESAGCK